MSNEPVSMDGKKAKVQKPSKLNPPKKHAEGPTAEHSMAGLQKIIGNRAIQRLLAQRSGEDAYQLDEGTTGKIEQERGAGQALDSQVQEKMGASLGHDFSNVKVHTSDKSDALNQQLNAEAFTTGNDVFFRQGNYNPASSDGQQLIAHELTHVVQQSTGQVSGGGSGMTVGAPHDSYEQQADHTAQLAVQRQASPEEEEVQTKAVQRQEMPEEEEVQTKAVVQQDHLPEEEEVQTKAVQREAAPEEEELQTKVVQRQEVPEEEELQTKAIQRQEMPEEEEPVQAKAIQRQEVPEEEELQTKTVQRQKVPEEEELQTKAAQRQEVPEEEELQTKTVQLEAAPEEEELQTKRKRPG